MTYTIRYISNGHYLVEDVEYGHRLLSVVFQEGIDDYLNDDQKEKLLDDLLETTMKNYQKAIKEK